MDKEKEQYLMVSYDGNWQDEFTVAGWWFTTKDNYERWWKAVDEVDIPAESSIGTNEAMLYEDINDYKNCFSTKKITEEEYKVVKKVFERNTHKNGYYLGDFIDLVK